MGGPGPGSFIEVGKILPKLVGGSGDHPSFHVISLSLPGFGFSSAPRKKGFGIPQYAEVCSLLSNGTPSWILTIHQVAHKLMMALGYEEYGAPESGFP